MQTRDQRYAVDVLKKVELVRQNPQYKKYGAMSHALPILIHTAGLAQALAFVASRKEAIFHTFLADLSMTVVGDEALLLKKSREDNLMPYIYMTRQTLAALLWYKRFAQSILQVETSESLDLNDTDISHTANQEQGQR
jgi:CRISPR-associated protein Cmr5